MKNFIYIYNDLGTSPNMLNHTIYSFQLLAPTYEVKTLDAYSLKNINWQQNASLLIIPGGADLPYVQQLNGLGNAIIQDFVKQGGSFLGICAGAYYSSDFVEFDKAGKYQVLGDRELKFFPGKSIGPILAKYDYFTNSGARAAEISTNFINLETLKLYYNGGGFFEKAEEFPNIDILARYSENNLSAVIKTNIGQGKVILSGVHFEVDPFILDQEDPHLAPIIPLMQEDNHKRIALLGEIVKLLLIETENSCIAF